MSDTTDIPDADWLAQLEVRIDRLENKLKVATKFADQWCSEYVKCRDALRKIYKLCEEEDPHLDLVNSSRIAALVLGALGKDGVKP